MVELDVNTPAKLYYDRDGKLIRIKPTYDYQNRIPLDFDDIPQNFKDAILSVEDHDFYNHGAISYKAILRAFVSLVTNGHVISGGSTITMQLVSLPWEGKRKSFKLKFIQIMRARRIEQLYSKDEILCEYINRIPCGGKIYGLEAASRYYFDKPAKELSIEEAALIAGLPQRPNALRPDRHPDRAMKRQLLVLKSMEKNKKIGKGQAILINQHNVVFRNFHERSYFDKMKDRQYDMYLSMAENNGSYTINTCLDVVSQNMILDVLKETVTGCNKVKDGAAILIDVKTSKVIAMVGTLNLFDKDDGQVNAAIAQRSAGSTLKPFFYADAIDGGIITSSTVLKDEPIHYGNYAPANYDGSFRGDVSAADALALSLNTPVISLLARLGVEREAELLYKLGIVKKHAANISEQYGLSFALGTAGASALDLANAYLILAKGGHGARASFVQNSNYENTVIFTEEAVCMLSGMLRKRALDGCVYDVAWKTGTSNGLHDAWCLAYTPDYVLAVWFGNKSGKASSELVGAKIAMPAAGRIMSNLYVGKKAPVWPAEEDLLKKTSFCAKSGMIPTSQCNDLIEGWSLPAFAVRKCGRCGKEPKATLDITSPKPMVYLTDKSDGIEIFVRSKDNNALWYVDGQYVGKINDKEKYLFKPGFHKLHAVSENADLGNASVSFTVQYEP